MNGSRRNIGTSIATGILIGVLTGPVMGGETVTSWVNSGGNWSSAGNWDCVCVPNNSGPSTYATFIAGLQTCNLDMSATINRMGIVQDSTVNHFNNRTLTILAAPKGGSELLGKLTLEGTYMMQSSGNLTNLVTQGGVGSSLQIDGLFPGTLRMSNSLNNRIYGATGNETILFGPDVTVAGAGQVGLNLTAIINEGTFLADEAAHLRVDPGAGGLFNDGLMAARDGGTLTLWPGAFDNTNGEIRAEDASTVYFVAGADVSGGLIVAQSGGTLELEGGTLTGPEVRIDVGGFGQITSAPAVHHLTNHGEITQNNNTTLFTSGQFTNTGDYLMNSSGNLTNLQLTADTVLGGGGTIQLTNAFNNRIHGASGLETFTNIDNTIRGAGQLGVNLTTLLNQGTIIADQTVSLRVDPGAGGMDNTGVMAAQQGGTLELWPATYDNTGGEIRAEDLSTVRFVASTNITGGLIVAENGGTLELEGGTLTGPTVRIDFGGVGQITGAPTIHNLINDGILDQNNNTTFFTSGQFNNTGDYFMNSSGNLTNLQLTGDTVLDGGGTIQMSNAFNNRIHGSTGTQSLTNVDNLIRGSGQIGLNLTTLINEGTIIGDQPAAIQIDPGAGGMTNAGLIAARDGGRIDFWPATYDNTPGEIRAEDLSTVRFIAGAFVTGGLIVAEGGGTLELEGGELTGPTVRIDSGGTGVVTIAPTVHNLTNDGILTQNNNTTLFTSGQFTNTGDYFMNSSGNLTNLQLTGDTVLVGAGTIQMTDSLNNRIYGSTGAESFTNVDTTIRGSGQIGVNLTTIDNRGTIIADQANAVRIDPGAGGMTNTGLMAARSGGTLQIWPATYDNTDGEIRAEDSSVVRFVAGANVSGGLIVAQSGGTLELEGGELTGPTVRIDSGGFGQVTSAPTVHNFTNHGTLSQNNNTTLFTSGQFANTGDFFVNSTGNLTNLVLTADTTLHGGGTIHLINSFNNRIYGSSGTQTLTNSGHTIRGSGQIGLNLTTIINEGSIIADQVAPIRIDPTGSAFFNDGSLIVEAGSELELVDGVTQWGGTTAVGGLLDLFATQTLDMQGGEVTGGGTINGDIDATAGAIRPGESAGEVHVTGDVTLDGCASVDIEIGGTLPGTEHDVVTIDGDLIINNGVINISYIDGYTPPNNSTFTIMTASSVSGVFADVLGPGVYQVVHNADNVQVTVLDAGGGTCTGDFDADGVVGILDLLKLLGAWGGCSTTHDLDQDGMVGILDLLALLGAWGTCP